MLPEEETPTAVVTDDPPSETPLADAPPAPEPEPKPPAESEEPPEKSASERLLDSVMELPEDERDAAFSSIEKRLEAEGKADTLPWRKRQQEDTASRDANAARIAAQERQQEDVRSWESNRDAARANVTLLHNDLSERWGKRGEDDAAPQLDTARLDAELTAYGQAEAALLMHGAIAEIGNAMNASLEPFGGAITQDELATIGKTRNRADIVRAYMDTLAARVRKQVSTEMDETLEQRIRAAVDAERGAIRTEITAETKVAPETKAGTPPGPKRTEDDILVDPDTDISEIREIMERRSGAA